MFRIADIHGTKKLLSSTQGDTFEAFLTNGSEKLSMNKQEDIRLFMCGGIELDDYEGLVFARDEKSTIYFLKAGEVLPQENEMKEQEKTNENSGTLCPLFENSSS